MQNHSLTSQTSKTEKPRECHDHKPQPIIIGQFLTISNSKRGFNVFSCHICSNKNPLSNKHPSHFLVGGGTLAKCLCYRNNLFLSRFLSEVCNFRNASAAFIRINTVF